MRFDLNFLSPYGGGQAENAWSEGSLRKGFAASGRVWYDRVNIVGKIKKEVYG